MKLTFENKFVSPKLKTQRLLRRLKSCKKSKYMERPYLQYRQFLPLHKSANCNMHDPYVLARYSKCRSLIKWDTNELRTQNKMKTINRALISKVVKKVTSMVKPFNRYKRGIRNEIQPYCISTIVYKRSNYEINPPMDQYIGYARVVPHECAFLSPQALHKEQEARRSQGQTCQFLFLKRNLLNSNSKEITNLLLKGSASHPWLHHTAWSKCWATGVWDWTLH